MLILNSMLFFISRTNSELQSG